MSTRTLKAALEDLERIAPPALAGDWDNVGLLVAAPLDRRLYRCLLCIDLTEPVLEEGIAAGVELVVAYHPPIFGPLRRLGFATSAERIARRAIEAGIAVHSPHTALDAAPGGVNDWLASAFPGAATEVLEPHRPTERRRVVRCRGDATLANALRRQLPELAVETDPSRGQLEIRCLESELPRVDAVLRRMGPAATDYEVWKPDAPCLAGSGQGRRLTLAEPLGIEAVLEKVRAHLGLRHLRASVAPAHAAGDPVRSVALCPGAGGSVLAGVSADVYWTGEMRHHDVLAARAAGRSVILCEHSNTERGYLEVLANRLREIWRADVEVIRSEHDRDPLEIV